MDEKGNGRLSQLYRIGLAVFILLAAMTIGEYFIGSIAIGWSWALWGVAILKAAMIVRDYMHLPRLFGAKEEVAE
jgi:hypothetical protein